MKYLRKVSATPEDPKLDSASVFWDSVANKIYCFGENTTPTYEMVDLGLSVKWATCNLGASSPEEYGNYYAWAETQGYPEITDDKKFQWSDYKWSDNGTDTMTKYNDTDGLTTIESSDDAATAVSAEYRMPTTAEVNELLALTKTVETINDISGMRFTSSNGNSIFIPFAGCYDEGKAYNITSYFYIWSSILSTVRNWMAMKACGNKYGGTDLQNTERYYGCSIRPVCE